MTALTRNINPATGEAFFEINNTVLESLPERMQQARAAQRLWSGYSFSERALYIRRMRDYIVANAEQLAQVVSQSNGKTHIDALATEVLPCTLACDWYSKNAEKHLAPKKRPGGHFLFINKSTEIARLPLGVVGIISPWNYPLSIPFGEIVMALMAGNAVLLKVAAATPAVGDAIEKIVAAAQLPEGLFQHLVGSGSDIANGFFAHGIDKLFFTGSVNTGKVLMRQAAETLTPLSLELGGNDAMIVLEDADLERATNGAIWAGFQNAGQSCGGVERIYVMRPVYQAFVELLNAKVQTLRHGADRGTHSIDIGALTTASQLRTVQQHVEDALSKGARIAAQSQASGITDNGFFFPATVLLDVNHEMLLMRDETFGPVLGIMPVDSEDEAVKLANDSHLALTSSVWSRNKKRARALALRIESGVTSINDHLMTHGLSETPWGGWKQSGLGRTHGVEGLYEMTHLKVVNYELAPGKRNLWWHPFNTDTWHGLLNVLRFCFGPSLTARLSAGIRLLPFALKKMFTSWKVD